MALNNRDIPELRKGDLFTAVLPSRAELLAMFKGEADDRIILSFIQSLSFPPDSLLNAYTLYTREDEGSLAGLVYIHYRLLDGRSTLLCSVRAENGKPQQCIVKRIIHSESILKASRSTDWIGYGTPLMTPKILTDIEIIRRGIII